MEKKNFGYRCKATAFAEEHLYYPMGMGIIECDREFFVDRSRFPGYLVMCCTAGKLWVEQYGTAVLITPGQSCLMTLAEPHRYYSDAKDPCDIHWLHFGGNAALPFLSFIREHGVSDNVVQDGRILPLIQSCMRLYKDGGANSCFDISAVIYRLLLLFLEKTAGFSGKEERGALVQLLDPFLEDHITEKITLESMADQCHLAPAYFCRRFRKETGLSPMQYLMKKRIETAKFYLLYTNEKVSVIAEKLGFYDSKHFSFCFGKVVGMPPTQYRSKNM